MLMSAVSTGRRRGRCCCAGFLVAGLGIGLVNPALATAAIGVVETRRAGMASGINSTFRQVGIATGIAVWGAIFEHKAVASFEAATGRPGNSNVILFGGARVPGVESAFVAGLDRILVLGGDRLLHRRRAGRRADPPPRLRDGGSRTRWPSRPTRRTKAMSSLWDFSATVRYMIRIMLLRMNTLCGALH